MKINTNISISQSWFQILSVVFDKNDSGFEAIICVGVDGRGGGVYRREVFEECETQV